MADAAEIPFELWIDRVMRTTWENVLTPQMRSVHQKWRAAKASASPDDGVLPARAAPETIPASSTCAVSRFLHFHLVKGGRRRGDIKGRTD